MVPPTPTPTPTPVFCPFFDGIAVDVGLDDPGIAEFAETEVMLVPLVWPLVGILVAPLILELDIPILAARETRFLILQHTSEVISPQHQLPSVEHCDTTTLPFTFPPSPEESVQSCFKQNSLSHDESVHDSRQYLPPVDPPQSSEETHGLWHSPFERHSSGRRCDL
jgi:hypothetical protein